MRNETLILNYSVLELSGAVQALPDETQGKVPESFGWQSGSLDSTVGKKPRGDGETSSAGILFRPTETETLH
ncbi:MAG: hypothetical protein E6Q88_02810 [Lysobacteraceae bacterium]|nr:MAG: hypothetical protein E6Q88_02810 [Xanthomonadaceae bacterium]